MSGTEPSLLLLGIPEQVNTRFFKSLPERRKFGAETERGAAIVLFVLLLPALLLLIGLAIDGGQLFLTQRRLQNLVDAATIRGMFHLPDRSKEFLESEAIQDVNTNLNAAQVTGIPYGTQILANVNPSRSRIDVQATILKNLFWMSLLPGMPKQLPVSASASGGVVAPIALVIIIDQDQQDLFEFIPNNLDNKRQRAVNIVRDIVQNVLDESVDVVALIVNGPGSASARYPMTFGKGFDRAKVLQQLDRTLQGAPIETVTPSNFGTIINQNPWFWQFNPETAFCQSCGMVKARLALDILNAGAASNYTKLVMIISDGPGRNTMAQMLSNPVGVNGTTTLIESQYFQPLARGFYAPGSTHDTLCTFFGFNNNISRFRCFDINYPVVGNTITCDMFLGQASESIIWADMFRWIYEVPVVSIGLGNGQCNAGNTNANLRGSMCGDSAENFCGDLSRSFMKRLANDLSKPPQWSEIPLPVGWIPPAGPVATFAVQRTLAPLA
ncbi:MAG: hypothetical protein DCC75_13910, partial [Proteobacteria bacterium]